MLSRRRLLASSVSCAALIASGPSLKAQVGNLFAGASVGVTPPPAGFGGDPNAQFSAIDTSGGILKSRDAGYLPAFVQVSAANILATGIVVNATGGTSTGSALRPYERLEYSWDFGDPGGTETFNNPYANNGAGAIVNANTDQQGPEAIYCYRTTGTKTITLTIRGLLTGGSSFITTTVQTTFVAKAFVETASFTGTSVGTALTVSGVTGTIKIGQKIAGVGVQNLTIIVAGSGTSWTTSLPNTVGPISMTATNAYYYDNVNGSNANSGDTPTTPRLTAYGGSGDIPIDQFGQTGVANLALFFANGRTYVAPPAVAGESILSYAVEGPLRVAGYSNPSFPSSVNPIFSVTKAVQNKGAIQYDGSIPVQDHVIGYINMQTSATCQQVAQPFKTLRVSSQGCSSGSANVVLASGGTTTTTWKRGQNLGATGWYMIDQAGSLTPLTKFGDFHGSVYSPTGQTFSGDVLTADTASTPVALFSGSILGSTLSTAPPPGWSSGQQASNGGTIQIGHLLCDLTGDVKPFTYIVGGSGTSWTLQCVPPIVGMADNGSGAVRLTLPPNGTTGLTNGSTCFVVGMPWATEINNQNWVITIIDSTHIDLVGSTFTNPFVYGGKIGCPTSQTVSMQAMLGTLTGMKQTDIYLDHCDMSTLSNETNGQHISTWTNTGTTSIITVPDTSNIISGTYIYQVTGCSPTTQEGHGLVTVINSTTIHLAVADGWPAFTATTGGTIYAGGGGAGFNVGNSTTGDSIYMAERMAVYGGSLTALTRSDAIGWNFGSYQWMSFFGVPFKVTFDAFGSFDTQCHYINPEYSSRHILCRWCSTDPGGAATSGLNFAFQPRSNNWYNGTPDGDSDGRNICVDSCQFTYSANGGAVSNENNIPPPTDWGSYFSVVYQKIRFGWIQAYCFYITSAYQLTIRDCQCWNVGSLIVADGLDVLPLLIYRNLFYRQSSSSIVYGAPSVSPTNGGIIDLQGSTNPAAQVNEITYNKFWDERSTAKMIYSVWADLQSPQQSFFDNNLYYTPNDVGGTYMKDNITVNTLATWQMANGQFDPGAVTTNPGWSSPSTGVF